MDNLNNLNNNDNISHKHKHKYNYDNLIGLNNNCKRRKCMIANTSIQKGKDACLVAIDEKPFHSKRYVICVICDLLKKNTNNENKCEECVSSICASCGIPKKKDTNICTNGCKQSYCVYCNKNVYLHVHQDKCASCRFIEYSQLYLHQNIGANIN
jgi:hypothetical protein